MSQTAIIIDPRDKQPNTPYPIDQQITYERIDTSIVARQFYQALEDMCEKEGGAQLLQAFNKMNGVFVIQMTDGEQQRPYVTTSSDKTRWWFGKYDKFKGYYSSYRLFCIAAICSDAINAGFIAHEISHGIDERMLMQENFINRQSNGFTFLHCLHADSNAVGYNPIREIIKKIKKGYKTDEYSDFDEHEAYAYAIEMFFKPKYRPENSPYIDAYIRRIVIPSADSFICGAGKTTALEACLNEKLGPLAFCSLKALHTLDSILLGKKKQPFKERIYRQVSSNDELTKG